jgi:hypothetical protein
VDDQPRQSALANTVTIKTDIGGVDLVVNHIRASSVRLASEAMRQKGTGIVYEGRSWI